MNKPIPFGKYYLLDRVNVGGMAEVFRAKAFGVEGFERIVAVKRILPTIAEDTDFITMFIDEAKIAVQLNHANIAQIFDLGKVGDSYFIALEYVHGKDLRAIFDLARQHGEPMPIAMACYVIMKVCEGLDYAHNKRDASGRDLELVHRDISPQNILISYDGDVKLIDFGIAKAAGKAGKTQAGILKGKFGYLSPEQVHGEEIDRRSDVFGVGIVLYELLTNERLFAGDSDFSTIEKVRNVEVPLPSLYNRNIPKALEQIVLNALAGDPNVRFQTAMELHDELQRFLYSHGESFARRDLSAWMRKNFADAGTGDLDSAPKPRPVPLGPSSVAGTPTASQSSRADERTDVAPLLEPAESKAVINETREDQGKNKNKSTILGMPAVLPPADLAAREKEAKGRTVPPPPPRSQGAGPGVGRSVPPPPPRGGAVQAIEAAPPAIPGVGAIPSVNMSSTGPIATRSVPPPPPRAGASMPPLPPSSVQAETPVNGVAAAHTLDQASPPHGNPVLDMDWDDEELSTQIYDRPEDQMGMSGAYEAIENGFEAVPSSPSQGNIATYVPPAMGANGMSSPSLPAAVAPAPAFQPVEVPVTTLTQPPMGSRAAQVTQPIATHQVSGGSRNSLWAALAVAAVVAACFVGYVFLAKTERGVVQLTTHPADATVLFDGKAVGSASPFLVTGVVPGEKHVLEVQKPGFRSWSQEVQVQPGQTLQFPVTLQPETASDAAPQALGASAMAPAATGGFSLETTPPGAKVYLDGNALEGATPMRVANLVPRRYALRVELAGFRAHTLDVDVASGVDKPLPRITLDPERLNVRVTSEPPGAEAVVVRGDERRALGKTPLDVTLENNGTPWNLEITRNGFDAYQRELTPENGQTSLAVQAVLVKTGASAPRPRAEPRAEPRPVSAEPAPVAAKEPVARRPEPVPAVAPSSGGGNGTLRINSRPWSQVFVDGKLIGNTPQMNVSLPEGPHRIVLVNPEFSLKKSVTINIKAGETETQIINLQ